MMIHQVNYQSLLGCVEFRGGHPVARRSDNHDRIRARFFGSAFSLGTNGRPACGTVRIVRACESEWTRQRHIVPPFDAVGRHPAMPLVHWRAYTYSTSCRRPSGAPGCEAIVQGIDPDRHRVHCDGFKHKKQVNLCAGGVIAGGCCAARFGSLHLQESSQCWAGAVSPFLAEGFAYRETPRSGTVSKEQLSRRLKFTDREDQAADVPSAAKLR